MGCVWIFAASLNSNTDDGSIIAISDQNFDWIQKFQYLNSSDFDLYTAAVYFSIQTMTTVGYGDISGTNTSEKYVSICMMVFGVVLFSVISGSISSLLDSMDEIDENEEK